MTTTTPLARAITSGPKHHFFGYYDKFQVSASGRYMLTLELDFMDRPPTPEDVARIGLIDLADNNRLEIVAETKAWCWQQSCMLNWLPSDPDRKIIFNVRLADRFGCCVLDLETGEKRVYDRPIYTLSSDGRFALCPNFSRLADERPGYGYVGLRDPWFADNAPKDDGIYRLDLVTGESRLIISLDQIVSLGLTPDKRGYKHRFNHLLISPDDQRFIFLHRWREPSPKGTNVGMTRFFTADVDGGDIRCLSDNEMTSHFIWRDAHTALAWARRFDGGDHYYFFDDTPEVRIAALAPDKLDRDGHMSYPPPESPAAGWLLTDTYPDPATKCRKVLLFHEASGRLVELGAFFSDPKITGEIRCDLHPRWSRDGHLVTFDSIHEGTRQIYAIDVTAVAGSV